MSHIQHLLLNKANRTKPPKHMAQTLEDSRNADMDTKVKTVIDILESMGHCPVTKLVEAAKGEDLNPQQQAAVNRWLMEQAYAKPKAVTHSGDADSPVEVRVKWMS